MFGSASFALRPHHGGGAEAGGALCRHGERHQGVRRLEATHRCHHQRHPHGDGAMRKTFHRVVLDGDLAISAGVFNHVGVTTTSSPAGNPVVGPNGHRVKHHHREFGIQTPLLVKGMILSPSAQPLPRPASHPSLNSMNLHQFDPHRKGAHPPQPQLTMPPPRLFEPHGEGTSHAQLHHWEMEHHTNPLGRLPKMDFPKFAGSNPKLWLSHCEDHFEMYSVERPMWIRVASSQMTGAAELWLQSVESSVRFAS